MKHSIYEEGNGSSPNDRLNVIVDNMVNLASGSLNDIHDSDSRQDEQYWRISNNAALIKTLLMTIRETVPRKLGN